MPFRSRVRSTHATDRQTDGRTDRHRPSFYSAYGGRGITNRVRGQDIIHPHCSLFMLWLTGSEFICDGHTRARTHQSQLVTAPPQIFVGLIGATENARPENAGRSKMQEWKMRDLKMRDQNAGAENAGPSSMESYLAIKCANGILMLCQPDISFSSLSTVITVLIVLNLCV